jgi:hypothetical protein
MRRIQELTPLPNYMLLVAFDTGEKKKVDLRPYLNFPVFKELQNEGYFKQVKNKGYFVEWPHEQDLSADTLYLEGLNQ